LFSLDKESGEAKVKKIGFPKYSEGI